MELNVKVTKPPRSIILNYDLGENRSLAQIIAVHGQPFCKDAIISQLKKKLTEYIRNLLRRGVDENLIRERVQNWTVDVTPKVVQKLDKALMDLESLSEDERKEQLLRVNKAIQDKLRSI